jgi:hypothetical protein
MDSVHARAYGNEAAKRSRQAAAEVSARDWPRGACARGGRKGLIGRDDKLVESHALDVIHTATSAAIVRRVPGGDDQITWARPECC